MSCIIFVVLLVWHLTNQGCDRLLLLWTYIKDTLYHHQNASHGCNLFLKYNLVVELFASNHLQLTNAVPSLKNQNKLADYSQLRAGLRLKTKSVLPVKTSLFIRLLSNSLEFVFLCSLTLSAHEPPARDSFYSESDSDSDNEDKTRKIHVEIKPAVITDANGGQTAASVDEIKKSLGGLTLSPPIVS